jgi:hypothetical protein
MEKIGYLGSALMMAASFNMANGIVGYCLAIMGLMFLTIQAVELKAGNLIMLNVVSVAGFLYSIMNGF